MTHLPPLPLQYLHDQGLIAVDGWVQFRAPPSVGVFVRELRLELDRTLMAKIQDPQLDLAQNKVVEAVMALLATDGF